MDVSQAVDTSGALLSQHSPTIETAETLTNMNAELTDAGGADCPCDDGKKKRDIAGRISLPLDTVFERNAQKARQA